MTSTITDTPTSRFAPEYRRPRPTVDLDAAAAQVPRHWADGGPANILTDDSTRVTVGRRDRTVSYPVYLTSTASRDRLVDTAIAAAERRVRIRAAVTVGIASPALAALGLTLVVAGGQDLVPLGVLSLGCAVAGVVVSLLLAAGALRRGPVWR